MDVVLLILYIAVLIAETAALVSAVRRPSGRKWGWLLSGEVVAVAAAWALMRWYDSRPGYGVMPGLTYFAETFYSMCAAAVYAVLLAVSLAAWAVVRCRSHERKEDVDFPG